MKISVRDYAERRPFPQWRFLQLTLTIFAWMAIAPFLEQKWSGHLAIQVLLLDLMLVTLWANPQWKRVRNIVLALWGLSVVVSAVSVAGFANRWELIERTLDVAFIIPVTLACIVGVAVFAFRAERPTIDGVFAMLVAYLLIAVVFAELYYVLLVWQPDALKLLEPVQNMTPRELRGELIYFSVVTISTVGYGDILPASPVARMLAMTEAVVGQFFVAVVVATFVSMYTTQAIEARVQARQQNPNAPPRD